MKPGNKSRLMDGKFACLILLSLAVLACDVAEQQPIETAVLDPVITVEAITSGANLAGANGMALGPDGNLYVASVLGSSITVMDPETGEVIKVWGEEQGVIGPDDIAFATDGSWYWTSIMTGEVAGFTQEGRKVIAAQLAPGVNPITFSDDGRLFVAQCFFGTNLYEVDPRGLDPARLISDTLGPGCGLNGMDWGPDGRLYGPRWFHEQVVSFDVNDNSMRVEATGFATPAAVKFDAQGRLHVLDTGTGTLYRVDDSSNIEVARLSPGLDNFVIDESGRIFVSSFTDGFVKRINTDGSVTELQPGGMAHAGGITYHQGIVVAADLHSIRGYQVDGQEAFTQRNVLGTGVMGGALNIASDGDAYLLVSWVDGDVRVWDQRNQQRLWQKSGLAAPVAAVRFKDLVVVSEHGANQVVGFAEDSIGEVVFATGLPAPTGLVVYDGELYVSDRSLGQILKLTSQGGILQAPEVVADGLTTPEGFVIREGIMVVVEADDGHVTLIRADGERQILATVPKGSQAASDLQPPSQVFNGIAMDDKGNLYVPGESDRVLYKITGAFD